MTRIHVAQSMHQSPIVLAAVAHPDDIEFMMAGTMLRLKERGATLHMWNLASGSCGTATLPRGEIVKIRAAESAASASICDATLHPAIADDLAIFYDRPTLARVAAGVREIAPDIVLTHSPADYMEDHQNVCRLIVSAVFARGMTNFPTDPPRPAINKNVTIYHALPHGLRDGMRRALRAGQYVDVAPALATKRRMLAEHRSQKQWLDQSQGMDSYLAEMESMSRAVGKMSGQFEFAEGWRRHLHLGLSPKDADPLAELLGDACVIDQDYEQSLD